MKEKKEGQKVYIWELFKLTSVQAYLRVNMLVNSTVVSVLRITSLLTQS